MPIVAALLPEFDHEMTGTRTALQRVPADRVAWQPHEKSMSLGRLATHIAEIPHFVQSVVNDEELDLHPVGGEPFERETPVTPGEPLLAFFDEYVKEARAMLAGAQDERLMQPWTLKSAGHTLLTMPRVSALRGLVMNHLMHHRGQLTVYLRLVGVPVPGLYGPSADERA